MKALVLLLFHLSLFLFGCKNNDIVYNPNKEIDDNNSEISDVLISEILSDPKKDGVEFVEIYNNSTRIIDISTLQLASVNSTGKRSKLHPISKSSLYIYPYTYKLLSLNSEIVESHYPIVDKEALHSMTSFPSLTNSQGAVILFRDEIVIDSLFYHANMHDIFIKSSKGVSLERVSFSKSTNAAKNFISSAAGTGYATPGYQNSQLENEEPIDQPIFLNSPSFAPNNGEHLEINLHFNQGGKMANLSVYNKTGKKSRTLLKSHRLGTKNQILWDGKDNNGKLLPIGNYYLSIEIYDSTGSLNRYKKNCVLAGKVAF